MYGSEVKLPSTASWTVVKVATSIIFMTEVRMIGP